MKTGYKKSRFNFVSHNMTGHLVYNTFYNSLTRLDDEEYNQYDKLSFKTESFRNALFDQGIIIKEDIDELQLYNTYTLSVSKYMNPKPSITVTPTMECNARCFYCYEEGVRCGQMSVDCVGKIISVLRNLDLSKGINLTWFGGEPLMNQEWMDYFSKSLKAENIEFSAFLISNGSRINDEVIEKMKNNWNVENIQITIDGSCGEYFNRKAYVDQNENVYYKILQTVKKLSRAGIIVQIRLNIDRDNIDSILEAVEEIQQLFYNNNRVTYYPAFLTGSKLPMSEREKIDVIKKIIELDKNKLPVNRYLYKLPKIYACFYNQKNAFSIDINGDVFVCERQLGYRKKAICNINSNMEPVFNQRELSGRRQECQSCVFLPKCLGGCHDAFSHDEAACFLDKYIITAYLEML